MSYLRKQEEATSIYCFDQRISNLQREESRNPELQSLKMEKSLKIVMAIMIVLLSSLFEVSGYCAPGTGMTFLPLNQ